MKSFKEAVLSDPEIAAKIKSLRGEVKALATKFPMPGFDEK